MSDPFDETTWIEVETHLPLGVEEIIERGGGTFVGKTRQLELENQIFRHLGPHPYIIEYKGMTADGLLLAFAENRSLEVYINSYTSTLLQQLTWSKQIAEAVQFIHGKRVIHCDLNPSNILVDKNLNLKLCDFQGRLFNLDGTLSINIGASEYSKYRLPSAQEDEASKLTDIFALGSVIYYIMNGHEPYPELDILTDEDKIRPLFEAGSFPLMEPTRAGDVIKKCWQSKYSSAQGAVTDLAELLPQSKY